MSREDYLAQCLYDAISALDVANLPDRIQVGNDWIYPQVAMHRLQSIKNVDKLFPKKG